MIPTAARNRDVHCPPVTVSQWGLAAASLALGGLGYFWGTGETLPILAVLLTVMNVALVIMVGLQAFRARLAGKFFLMICTLVFFWLEAVDLARQNPPFAAPSGLPIIWGQFSPDLVSEAYLYVSLFQFALLAGYSLRPRLRPLFAWVGSRVDSPSRPARILPYMLAASALVPLLLSYGFDVGTAVQALLASRSAGVPESQDVGLLHNLYFLGVYGAALLLTEVFVFRGLRQIPAILFGGAAALPFIMGGTRHLWLFVGLPLFVLTFNRSGGRVNVARAVRVGAVGILVLIVSQLQYSYRDVGWFQPETGPEERLYDVGSTGQFTALLFAEYLVPAVHDYFLEAAEPYFLIHWIPRAFWSDKPVMRSWAYYNQAYTRGQAYNVTPSVIGQFHLNWGVAGVAFIGLWLGFLTYVADGALSVLDIDRQRSVAVVIGMFYAFIISSFRFYSPVYFTYFMFGLVGMLLMTRTEARRREVRGPAPAPVPLWLPPGQPRGRL